MAISSLVSGQRIDINRQTVGVLDESRIDPAIARVSQIPALTCDDGCVGGGNALSTQGRIAYIVGTKRLGEAPGLTWDGRFNVNTTGSSYAWFRNSDGTLNYDLALGRDANYNVPMVLFQTSDYDGPYGDLFRVLMNKATAGIHFSRGSQYGIFDAFQFSSIAGGGTQLLIGGSDSSAQHARIASCSIWTQSGGDGCWFYGSAQDWSWKLLDQGQNTRIFSGWGSNATSIGGEDSSSTLTVVDTIPSQIGGVTFSGNGSNDLSVTGEYTGSSNRLYCVQIDGVSPDTMRWSREGCTNWAQTGVPLPTSSSLLEDGIYISFGSSTGHSLNDAWTFQAYVGGITSFRVKAGVGNSRSSPLVEAASRSGDRFFAAFAGDGAVFSTGGDYPGGVGSVYLSASQSRGSITLYGSDESPRAFFGVENDGGQFWSLKSTENLPLFLGANGQVQLKIKTDGVTESRSGLSVGFAGPTFRQSGSNIVAQTNDGSSMVRVLGASVTGADQYIPYGGTSAPSNGCATWVNGKLISTGVDCGTGGGGGGGGAASKTFSSSTTWLWPSSEHGITNCDFTWEAYTVSGDVHTWTQGMSSYTCTQGSITVTWPVATAGKLVINAGGGEGSGGGGGGMAPPSSSGLVVWDGLATQARSIAGTAGKIVVSNGDGVSGNPTVDVGADIVDRTASTTYSAGAKQTFQPSSSTAGINVVCASLPSNPSTGDIACDSADSNKLKQFANGTWNELGGSSGGGGGGSEFDPSQTYDLSGNNKVNMAYSSFYLQNDSATGTALYRTVCLTSAGLAVQCSSGNYQRAIGICMEGCGTTGNARIGVMGKLTCDFDGSVTAGNWVTASSSQPGKCADAGTAKPAIPLGIVLVTQTGQGSYDIVKGIQ